MRPVVYAKPIVYTKQDLLKYWHTRDMRECQMRPDRYAHDGIYTKETY